MSDVAHPRTAHCSWTTAFSSGLCRFLDDGRFVWGSEGDGQRRIYLHDRDGKLVRPITPEGWGIASLEEVVDGGAIVTPSAKTSSANATRIPHRVTR